MGKRRHEDSKAKVPAWMVSFGDMMTLILTFFILLVSLSKERQTGLVAKGVGSFVARLDSFGLDSLMSAKERDEVFNQVRVRFNLPPEEDPDQAVPLADAARTELLRAESIAALPAHDELYQPAVAIFPAGQSDLPSAARRYLDLLAPSLRPGNGQVLVLEARADPADPTAGSAERRARAVRQYLVERHGFEPGRIEARAWLKSPAGLDEKGSAVDARLILPARR
jgi:chemotaxis protein MotB